MLHEQDKFGWERQPQIAGSTNFLSIRSSVLEAAQDAKGVFAAACKPTFSEAKQ